MQLKQARATISSTQRAFAHKRYLHDLVTRYANDLIRGQRSSDELESS